MKSIAHLQKKAEIMFAEKERLQANLDHVVYQINLYEKKIWTIIENNEKIKSEFSQRTFKSYNSIVKDLQVDKNKLIREIDKIKNQLDQCEQKIWRAVETNALLLFFINLH